MARTGMADLITELRALTEAAPFEYTVAATNYWSDDQLQNILDGRRMDIIFEQLSMYPVQVAGGSISYLDYRSSNRNYEATTGGTAILYLQDSTGATMGTANYTPDYRRGQFQFSSDQRGTVYYLTGRAYDLNAAAAEVWRRKTAHYAPTAFDFSTDNHSISRSQIYLHCKEMAEQFENQGAQAVETIQMFRSDVP